MTGRRRARQIVLQLIFQTSFQRAESRTAELDFIANRLGGDSNLIHFAQTLLTGIRDHAEHIDTALQATASNWKIARMAPTDLSALRLGAYEILFTDTPHPVVINEAIELAKRFGTGESGKFVNGILDRLAKEKSDRGTDDNITKNVTS